MLSSIVPVVDGKRTRSARRAWLLLAFLHSLGASVSATSVGVVLAALCWVLRQTGLSPWHVAPWGALLVVVLYLPRLLGWTRLPPYLQSTCQVPRRWAVDYPRWLTALLFGLGLGSGLYTRIIVPTFYLLLVWPFLTPGFLWPVLLWGSYGWARSLHVWWLASTAPLENPCATAHTLMFALTRKTRWMLRANAALLLVVAVWLVTWGLLG
jgi:hypothetical protein